MAQFISIEEPRRPTLHPTGFALWQLGFRPFYLLASLFAALSIGLWAAQYAGWLGRRPYPPPIPRGVRGSESVASSNSTVARCSDSGTIA